MVNQTDSALRTAKLTAERESTQKMRPKNALYHLGDMVL